MDMMKEKPEHIVIITQLTPDTAGDWQCVGRVLLQLDALALVAPNGGPWHELVQDRLKEVGHPVSVGHLHKVRRAYGFLISAMGTRNIPKERQSLARISSIEIVERLSQLDSDSGLDALEACLDPRHPATAAHVQQIYKDILEAHPERKTPLQAAWDKRKQDTVTAPDAMVDQATNDQSGDALLGKLSAYVRHLESTIAKQTATISSLEEELQETQLQLQDLQHDNVMRRLSESRAEYKPFR